MGVLRSKTSIYSWLVVSNMNFIKGLRPLPPTPGSVAWGGERVVELWIEFIYSTIRVSSCDPSLYIFMSSEEMQYWWLLVRGGNRRKKGEIVKLKHNIDAAGLTLEKVLAMAAQFHKNECHKYITGTRAAWQVDAAWYLG